MYLNILSFTLLCILVGVSGSQHHHKHRHPKSHHPERLFEHVARDIISADRKLYNLCTDNNDTDVKLYYEPTEVKIVANLQGFPENKVEVKTKHRVLFIHAETEGKKRDRKVFADVKVLPLNSDTKLATWTFSNGVAEIIVPYNKQTPCGDEIDDEEVCVHKSTTHEGERTGENEIGDIRLKVEEHSDVSEN